VRAERRKRRKWQEEDFVVVFYIPFLSSAKRFSAVRRSDKNFNVSIVPVEEANKDSRIE
jgi:hypothetical protein